MNTSENMFYTLNVVIGAHLRCRDVAGKCCKGSYAPIHIRHNTVYVSWRKKHHIVQCTFIDLYNTILTLDINPNPCGWGRI